ncbi:TPA: WxL domain-containing protein [Enterococcus faecalis]|nr:WxL domain-containing protein [Enterococcus faecalis]
MKKKIMANLLVGSAVVGASLAPLSAQAVTTGNTPVQVEFGGGKLPDQDNNTITGNVDPDPTQPNTDFDLLAIPRRFGFSPMKINDDLSAIEENVGFSRSVMVGDVRGTKEGWHVTGELTKMSNGTDELTGDINFGLKVSYAEYWTHTNSEDVHYYRENDTLNGVNIANDPTAPSAIGTSIKIGGGAAVLMNATVGKGQGTWAGRIDDMTLNVTTPYQQIKAGAYTGNITWNLVAGPSI